MFSQSFSDGLGIKLTERTEKPRKSGLTMIIDVGHTKQEVSDVLDSYGAYIDVIKIADPNMSQPIGEIAKKVALLKAHHVEAQPGGIIIEIARLQKKIHDVLPRLKEIGIPAPKPKGAFYAFARLPEGVGPSAEFSLKLLESEHISATAGSAFGHGGENHIRISYANSLENIKEAMDRIERFLAK